MSSSLLPTTTGMDAATTATVTTTVTAASASSTYRVAPQGGILEGLNPTVYDPKNPITIFIIQAGIIIVFCRLLHWPLSKIRQPRVIAEVIGGILLGPSVLGRVPGFTNTIFPAAAMPNLTLVANIGLILFLFLVGLEVDLRLMVANWRVATTVGIAGMALPFGLGCAIAYGLYHQFAGDSGTVPIAFGTYMLFIGVAMAITAFPVLCRILAELKLLSTPVGVITLAAGVSNDVVGWVLLALCVALVNAGTGLTALYILLTALGYVLFLVYAVRPAFLLVLRRTRSIDNGPSQGVVALTLLLALVSAFFTGVIGIHPIFGAFLVGLICPHDGGFAIKVTEKVEDLVSTVFLPLYFALSGLSTNLGLLDSGIVWGYVIGIIIVALTTKFVGGTLAARLNGLVWRESMTIGVLMSCKGLVELIVLNIGLSAKILSQRTFTMFVVMALVTTFLTTPLTSALYPPWYQKKLDAWKRGQIDWDTGEAIRVSSDTATDSFAHQKNPAVKSLLVYLRLDNMPSLVAFLSLLGKQTSTTAIKHPTAGKEYTQSEVDEEKPVAVHGVRLMELTERGSSVMQVSEVVERRLHDPLINMLRIFGRLHNISVSGELTVAPENDYADLLTYKAAQDNADLLLLPWSESGSMSELQLPSSNKDAQGNNSYSTFVSQTLEATGCDAAVFVGKGGFGGSVVRPAPHRINSLKRQLSGVSLSNVTDDRDLINPAATRGHHIFVPFFGGRDDRLAVRLTLQLAKNPVVTVTMVSFSLGPSSSSHDSSTTTTTTTNDDGRDQDAAAFFASLQKSLPADIASRIVTEVLQTSEPVQDALARAESEASLSPDNAGNLVVVGRNKDLFSPSDLGKKLSGEGSKNACLGVVGGTIVAEGSPRSSVLVVQAHRNAA